MKINLQIITKQKNIPSPALFKRWAKTTLPPDQQNAKLTIRIVDEPEIINLNEKYRHKKGSTNVLAFPVEAPVATPLLGDVIICAPVAIKEAQAQNKSITAHFAHLTIHGILHLLGYDHLIAKDRTKMEKQEIKILSELRFPNPY
jgi:probable rRNA maturation factor